MTIRKSRKTLTLRRPFALPAGAYTVDTREELLEAGCKEKTLEGTTESCLDEADRQAIEQGEDEGMIVLQGKQLPRGVSKKLRRRRQ